MSRYLLLFFACLVLVPSPRTVSQTKFYNYYSAGLEFLEKRDWVRAIGEFQSAISLEFEDAGRKRTYGTHFIEYYPHREMGYAHYQLHEFAEAKKELELSYVYDATDRAEEILKKIDPKCDPQKMLREAEQAKEQRRLDEERARQNEQAQAEAAARLREKQQLQAEEAERVRQAENDRRAEAMRRQDDASAAAAKARDTRHVLPTYDPASVTQVGSRLAIAVVPFTAKGEGKLFADAVTETMITKLVNLRRFKVIERSAIDKVMKEQKFQASGIVDDKTAVKLGKVAGADAIIVGSILLNTGTGKFSARVIDVESSETIVAENAPIEKPIMEVVEQVVENVATMIYNDLPLAEGVIVKIDKDEMYINIGITQGVRKGSKCVVFREGEPIQHPVTGEVLGRKVTRLGELLVVQVQDKIASLKQLETDQALQVGDKVVIK
jgi:TolB-like protein